MLTCRDVTGLLSDGLERPLTWREKLSLRMHTLMCRSCRNYARQLPF
ncbi:MAG: zf-HC2 domain-containing protein, partial [Pseudomonadota bacterium]|nr:zf-HC2 domain-containing protein [Pseudomonadota bacterium]